MSEVDYEKLFKTAKAYGIRMGLGSDAEDFAQECLIKAFEVGNIRLEYIYLNYRDHHRADKRILSGPEGSLSSFRTVSLDAPIDSTNENSARLSDVIGVSGDDVESRSDLEFVSELLTAIIKRVKSKSARDWANRTYLEWISDHVL